MKKVLLMGVLFASATGAFAQDAKALNAEFQALKGQVDKAQQEMILAQGNAEKAKTFYGLVSQLFDKGYEVDKVAEQPDAKGKVNNKFRKGNAETMHQNRPQLINAGVDAFNSNDNKTALDYFGKYVEAAKSPMFAKYNYEQTDTMLPTIAYYACIAAARMEDQASVLKYADYGIKDKENGATSMELKCAALKALNKSDEFLACLKQGLEQFPNDNYFVGNMIDYYTSQNQYDEALKYIDSQIAKAPSNHYFYFVKGYLLQTQKKYEEADAAYKKSIELKGDFAQSQSYAGLNLCQDAIAMGEDPNADEAALKALYQRALPYYEKARELAPDDKSLWLNGLYTCYYRLGMTEKAAEVEKLM